MATLRSLIDETKRHLLSGDRPAMNKLATTIDTDDTTLTFTYATSAIQAGHYIEIDLEVMYVWESTTTSKTVVVERAQLGSVAAAHTAAAVVRLNPRFPDFAIAKALNDDLLDLSTPANGLYAVRSLELTGTSASDGYDLTGATDLLEVLGISASHPGAARTWFPVTNYDVSHNAETDDFASGYALRLHEGVWHGRQLRVLYKASFSPLVNLADDVETVAGLPASMHDIPPMGAAVRLIAPREIARNDSTSQGDTRRANEVPPGAIGASMRVLAGERMRRIAGEAGRLAQQHPERQNMPQPVYGWTW